MTRWLLAFSALALGGVPAAARDNLGVFGVWGAFYDANIPRCYAIAQPTEGRGYASIGTWPLKKIRGQLHVRLSQPSAAGNAIVLTIGSGRYLLNGRDRNAWAKDARMDAAIVAAMRSAKAMTVSFRNGKGQRLRDRYDLPGVASAMDAATVACSRKR